MRMSLAKLLVARQFGIIIVAVAGCATQATQDIGPDTNAMFAAQAEKCRVSYQDPALDPIRSKTPSLSGIQQPTLEMLSDTSRPNDEQKAAILLFDRRVIECENGYAAIYAIFGSDYVAAQSRKVGLNQALRADLYQGKITFGEYVQRGTTNVNEFKTALAELDRQQEQMRIQRIQAAAALMSATPAPTPITFHPIETPQPINCTSTRIGDITNTTCR